MLKRFQVLLSDWQDEYVNLVCMRYDLSASSVIRLHLGLAILYSVQLIHPEYKPDIQPEVFKKLSEQASDESFSDEEVHHWMSKLLLEGRKAAEYRMLKEKEGKMKIE